MTSARTPPRWYVSAGPPDAEPTGSITLAGHFTLGVPPHVARYDSPAAAGRAMLRASARSPGLRLRVAELPRGV